MPTVVVTSQNELHTRPRMMTPDRTRDHATLANNDQRRRRPPPTLGGRFRSRHQMPNTGTNGARRPLRHSSARIRPHPARPGASACPPRASICPSSRNRASSWPKHRNHTAAPTDDPPPCRSRRSAWSRSSAAAKGAYAPPVETRHFYEYGGNELRRQRRLVFNQGSKSTAYPKARRSAANS